MTRKTTKRPSRSKKGPRPLIEVLFEGEEPVLPTASGITILEGAMPGLPTDSSKPHQGAPKTTKPGRRGNLKDGEDVVDPSPALDLDALPVIGRKITHFCDLTQTKVLKSAMTKPAYLALENMMREGLPLDPSLRAVGFHGGMQDERWQRFETMFPAQSLHLKRVAALSELDDVRRIREGGRGWQSLSWTRERTQTELYGQRQKTGGSKQTMSPIAALLAGRARGK